MNNQLIEGEDFYYDKKGLMVFTEKFHLKKGFCCGNGCLHCPYGYNAVAEPYRSQLLLKQQLLSKSSDQKEK